MYVLDSKLSDLVLKSIAIEMGEIHLFHEIAIIEFKEGADLNIKNTLDLVHYIQMHFGLDKPFALISNRVNSYAMQPLDSRKVKQQFPNLKGYGVVATNSAARLGAEIENDFCTTHEIIYTDLCDAFYTLKERVTKSAS